MVGVRHAALATMVPGILVLPARTELATRIRAETVHTVSWAGVCPGSNGFGPSLVILSLLPR